jgi:hypothetical protein
MTKEFVLRICVHLWLLLTLFFWHWDIVVKPEDAGQNGTRKIAGQRRKGTRCFESVDCGLIERWSA